MNRIFFLLIGLTFATTSTAQSIIDGLRYGIENNYGTARYNAMGGAFGALGGDLSAMSQNPAGSAVYLESSSSVTLGVLSTKNKTNYFNTQNATDFSDVELNQAGAVFVFYNPNESSVWNKFSVGFNYQLSNSFNDEYYTSGTSNSSIDSYFLHYAQGLPLNLLQTLPGESISSLYSFLGSNYGYGAQQAFLGYQAYIFDPTNPENPDGTSYLSNIAPGNFNQEFFSFSDGYNAKYTFNIGAQLRDNLYLGINLNAHAIEYYHSNYFYENNSNTGSLVNRVYFENHLAVNGDGFSSQIGIISKATENIRLGLTYHTPVWFTILEESTQKIETRRTIDGQVVTASINPNIINIYEEYKLRTPGKVTASAAYLFDKNGLISIDYSYKDPSKTKFSPSNDFLSLNTAIDNSLKGVSTINAGAEYRWNQLSLRGGYTFETSPYENTDLMSDLNSFSFGLGYSFGDFKLDASFSQTTQERSEQFYQNTAFTNASNIKSTIDFYSLTAQFNF